jgi:drug/metabolite transporter (DMT)-like permease
MEDVLLGLLYALTASVLFNVGIVLQAIDARTAPGSLGLRWALLGRLFRQPIWVVGWLLGIAGIWPQVASYGHAPFVVAQPALAVGLLIVLVLGARVLHEHVGAKDVLGVSAIIGGVVLVAWGAPDHAETQRGLPDLIAVVALLSLGGLVPFLVRGRRLDTGMTTVLACGFGFAAANVATKLLGDDFSDRRYIAAFVWGVAGLVSGAFATITNMTAFQRCNATIVVPVSTAVQTFLPILVEPLFLDEHWGSANLDGVPLFAGLVLALGGSLAVTGSAAVSGIFARAA